MTIATRLSAICDQLPDGAAVSLPVGTLRQWLAEGSDDVTPDLTVTDIAAQLGRHPSTVRGWIRAGLLESYKLNEREHRVTRAALSDFLDRQRNRGRGGSSTTRQRRANLGAWRKRRRK